MPAITKQYYGRVTREVKDAVEAVSWDNYLIQSSGFGGGGCRQ